MSVATLSEAATGGMEQTKNETITLIIPPEMASAESIQVVTLPPGISAGDIGNVQVQVTGQESVEMAPNAASVSASFNTAEPQGTASGTGSTNEPEVTDYDQAMADWEKCLDIVIKAEKPMIVDKEKVSIAVQANDYEIERRSGRTPARMRVIPAKFRDFHNPDNIKEEEVTSDEEYKPSDEWEFQPTRGRSKRIHSQLLNKESRKPRRPGRPRKYPKVEPQDLPTPMETDSVEGTPASMAVINPQPPSLEDSPQEPDPDNTDNQESSPEAPHMKFRAKADCSVTTVTIDGKFQCGTCSKKFSLKGNLKAHEFIHTGLKPYKCDAEGCDKSFRTSEACKRHKLTHTGMKLFECEVCQKKFSTNQALKEHTSRHTNSRPHECNICRKRFRQVSCLSRHMSTHSEAKPYECAICSKKFSQLAYLKSHQKSHTGERPHKCDTCEKAFSHQSDLTRHKVIHSGKKPYACDLCNARFNDPSSRRRHMREHTVSRPYSCQLCGEQFRRAGQLKVHLSKSHMGVLSKSVVSAAGDTSCLRVLVHENGRIETIPVAQGSGNAADVITVSAGKDQAAQLQQVQSQLQQVLMQLRQQRNQSQPGMPEEVDVHVVTMGGDEAVQGRVDHIIAQTLESMGQTARVQTIDVDQEQEIAVQIALEEIGVSSEDVIHVENSELSLAPVDNSGQSSEIPCIIQTEVCESQYGPLSPSVLSTAQIMQDIRNTPVQHEHAYTSSAVYPSSSQQTVASDVVITEVQSEELSQESQAATPTESQESETAMQSIEIPIESIVIQDENGQHNLREVNPDSIVQYEIVGQMDGDVVTFEVDESALKPDNPAPNPPPASMMDYVQNPDFSSQEYYNWLSSFVELCKVVPMPLDLDLFQKVSQVHKTLSDVLANPTGVLSNKENFETLMSISRDLGGIVNEHLTFVLKNLEKSDAS